MAINAFDILTLDLPAFIIGIGIHEFAHAWTADKLGDSTPRSEGRVSLNLFRHLDPLGVALPMILSYFGSPLNFGWGKPVRFNPENFGKPMRDYGLTALAGPLSNLLLCIAIGIFLQQFPTSPRLLAFATSFTGNYFFRLLFRVFIFNMGLFIFNILPIPPLDGSKILSWLGGRKVKAFMDRIQIYSFFILIMFLFLKLDEKFLLPVFAKLTSLLCGPMAKYLFNPAQFIADNL
ncbi:MAG: site-2 protease family protein [Candidatus Riflebacteria bacterium]|nr:site-2 protease family protein [Candidatus Riflebacteria bacterium]